MEVVMANKTLFSSLKSLLPRADARNEAGGRAYQFAPKHALAQLAATGCFNGTFYGGRQRPGAAHAAADDPFGPVRPHEPVVQLAAGVPALAE